MNISKQDLPLEKQLNIQVFANQLEKLPDEEIRTMCLYLYEQLHIQEAMYKALMQHNWFKGNDSFIPY